MPHSGVYAASAAAALPHRPPRPRWGSSLRDSSSPHPTPLGRTPPAPPLPERLAGHCGPRPAAHNHRCSYRPDLLAGTALPPDRPPAIRGPPASRSPAAQPHQRQLRRLCCSARARCDSAQLQDGRPALSTGAHCCLQRRCAASAPGGPLGWRAAPPSPRPLAAARSKCSPQVVPQSFANIGLRHWSIVHHSGHIHACTILGQAQASITAGMHLLQASGLPASAAGVG